MSAGGTIRQLGDIAGYLKAGKAKFTLVSLKSGRRYTFRTRPTKDDPRAFFVDLLVGPDNGADYRYLAFLRVTDFGLRVSQGKQVWAAEAFESIAWLIRKVNEACAIDNLGEAQRSFEARAEFWHAGSCAKCGRELTDPASIATGLGPVCGGRAS